MEADPAARVRVANAGVRAANARMTTTKRSLCRIKADMYGLRPLEKVICSYLHENCGKPIAEAELEAAFWNKFNVPNNDAANMGLRLLGEVFRISKQDRIYNIPGQIYVEKSAHIGTPDAACEACAECGTYCRLPKIPDRGCWIKAAEATAAAAAAAAEAMAAANEETADAAQARAAEARVAEAEAGAAAAAAELQGLVAALDVLSPLEKVIYYYLHENRDKIVEAGDSQGRIGERIQSNVQDINTTLRVKFDIDVGNNIQIPAVIPINV